MKFRKPSMDSSKVMCIKRVTNRQTKERTNEQMDKPKAICPTNFFEIGGITSPFYYL